VPQRPVLLDPVLVLGRRGVHDVAVRRALMEVDRATFTRDGDAAAAGEDRPITDEEGRSVMAPGALAVLLEALAIVSGNRVLVLGSGGGYVAAVVARIAASVDVVEPNDAWASAALESLTRAGARRVRVLVGDLSSGPEGERYDRILVTGVLAEPPVQLATQLVPRGFIVAPVGDRIHPDVVRIARGEGDTAPVATTLGKVELASRLGDVLVELHMASRASVEAAVSRGHEVGKRLGEVMSSEGTLREHDLALALAAQRGLSAGSVEHLLEDVDPAVSRVVSRAFLERHRVLPLRRQGDRILVATCDPDANVVDLQKALGSPTSLVLVSPTDYRRLWGALDLRFQEGERPRVFSSAAPIETDLLARHDLDARCVALFETLLLDAVGERASDVHLERYGDRVRVRLRVDGELRDVARMQWTPDDLVGVVNVIKVAAGLDIAERRLPQGGRIRRHAGAQVYDLRVQTQPSLHGEHVVVRLLPQEQRLLTVEDLGFAHDVAASYRRMLDSPAGLVLVVGPTGSGKTTTLYAGLQILSRDPTRKVLTIEDPIEYSIDLVQQSQAKSEIGFSFASAMRAFVREDPDVILVGEIRDAETALEAIRASQTGHVVLSTLHCNDATDAVQRLLDLGMHPNSIASELLAVFAQRLSRRICPACRREATPEKDILAELYPRGAPKDFVCFVGAGCDRCAGHGTLGRIAVVEHLRTGAIVRRAIARREPLDELRRLAIGEGLSTMRAAALDLVRRGVIPLREVPWLLSAERMADETGRDA
jgi:type IV pilus assembly protein PilB